MKLDSIDLATSRDEAHRALGTQGADMTTIDLTMYCRPRFHGERRYRLELPFNQDDHSIATDGVIMVRVPTCWPDEQSWPHSPTAARPPHVAAITARFKGTGLSPLPKVALPAPSTCWLCCGAGRAVACECDDDPGCEKCRLTGFIPAKIDDPKAHHCHICFGTGLAWPEGSCVALTSVCAIAPRYYDLLQVLPGIQVDLSFDSRDISGVGGGLSFKFEGGDGMLMPLRYDPRYSIAPEFHLKNLEAA